MNRWGNPKRTRADKVQDAILFIHQARDHIVLAATADELCATKGVSKREDQRRVEAALVARQSKIRRTVGE
jgi:hypothetical protein